MQLSYQGDLISLKSLIHCHHNIYCKR